MTHFHERGLRTAAAAMKSKTRESANPNPGNKDATVARKTSVSAAVNRWMDRGIKRAGC
jgi:hypothetical protein